MSAVTNMDNDFGPEFIGAVPWKGPGLSNEEFMSRSAKATARGLARLTVDPEYGRWMADKRKWGFKKFATAGLLLALIGGITAVAVQPQLWPTSVNSFYPSFTSSISGGELGALRTAGEVPAAAYPAERGFLGNVEEQNETGAARPKMAGIAESLSHPKTTLEAQLKSGQKFIKDNIFNGGFGDGKSGHQAKIDSLEGVNRDLEGSAWYDRNRIAELQERIEELDALLTTYTTLLTGLCIILGSFLLHTRRRLHQQEAAQQLAIEKTTELQAKLENEIWNHILLQDLHEVQSREKASLEQELKDLQQVHYQLLQSQSKVVVPPPGLQTSPFGDQAVQEDPHLSGNTSDEGQMTAAQRQKLVVELFPEKQPRRSTSSTGGYWPAGPRGSITRVPAINIEEKENSAAGNRTADPSGTLKNTSETQGMKSSGLSEKRSGKAAEGMGEKPKDQEMSTLTVKEARRVMYDIDQKEKYVKYVDSENRCLNKEISCLEAQLEQVTASLTHFVEDKSTSKERMHTHTDSQDLNEMAVALGRKIKDLEFVEAEFLALQQVARQAVHWLDHSRNPPADVLRAMKDRLLQCSQHFGDKINSQI